jgi:fatty acid desaturase
LISLVARSRGFEKHRPNPQPRRAHIPLIILALFVGTALIRLGIALVWVSVLTTALAASGALIALLLAVIGWRVWKRR